MSDGLHVWSGCAQVDSVAVGPKTPWMVPSGDVATVPSPAQCGDEVSTTVPPSRA